MFAKAKVCGFVTALLLSSTFGSGAVAETISAGTTGPNWASGSDASWSATPLPALRNHSGTAVLFQRDRKGWITQAEIDANWNKRVTDSKASDYPWRRMSIASPDGSEAVRHRVVMGDVVVPLGFKKYWSKTNSFRGVLLRFQMYATAYRGRPGKIIELEGGRGWTGDGFRHGSDSFFGSDGWGFNAMSALSGPYENKLRMLSTFENMSDSYTHSGNDGASAWPLHQWITIDLLVDMTDGYRIFQDGTVVTAKLGVNPPYNGSDAKCKAIGLVWRLMHGGNPGGLPPLWEYSEYFRNFELFVYP